MKKTLILALMFAGTTFFWSCKNNADEANTEMTDTTGMQHDPVGTTEDMNDEKMKGQMEDDAKHVVEIYSGSMLEVTASEMAEKTSKNADVKSLAKMMAEAHKKMNEDIKTLAASKNISLPMEEDPDKKADIEKMKTDKDFNMMYVDKIISMHKDAIDLAEKLSNNAADADVKAKFTAAVPELKHHLEMAEQVQEKLKAAKK